MLKSYIKKWLMRIGSMARLTISLGSLIFLTCPLSSESILFGKIEWKPVPLASSYQIQIKDHKGAKIIDKQIVSNNFPIQELPVGNFQVRVGIVSPFGSIVVYSGWNPIEIRYSNSILSKEKSSSEPSSDSLLNPSRKELDKNSNKIGSLAGTTSIPSPETLENKMNELKEKNKPTLSDLSVSDSNGENNSKSPNDNQINSNSKLVKCSNSQIPQGVIKECKGDFIVLDLGSKEKRSIYNIYMLNSNNRSARIQVARYYQEQCKMGDSQIITKFKELLASQSPGINAQEKSEYKHALDSIQNCR